jgi:hypothetical protein
MSHPSWLDSIRVSLGRPRADPAPRRSLRSSHMRLGLHQSWFRMLGLSLGKVRRKFDPSEGNFRGTTESARITPVVAPNACWAVSRDGAGHVQCSGGNSSTATLRARVTPVVGVRMRAAPLSGGSVAYLTYWGQLRYNPRPVRESRLSWPLDAHRCSLGSDGRVRKPWSLLQSGHAARVEDCACRGLERAATPSGAA